MLNFNTKRKLISVAVAGAWMAVPAAAQTAAKAEPATARSSSSAASTAPQSTAPTAAQVAAFKAKAAADAAAKAKAKAEADAKAKAAAAPAEATVSAAAPAMQSVTVSGFRSSNEDALRIKRDSDGFVDAISADGLGRFPDLNVGEAMSRIPGVQIDRDAADRSATISLRGLPGTFSKYTVNGFSLASPAGAGALPLGTFPSAVFTRFVVNKSPSSTDAAGGLSGNIDLQTSGALARKDGGDIQAAYEYNELGKIKAPSLTMKYAKHFGKDVAVYATLVHKKENFRRDSLNMGYRQAFNPTYTDGVSNGARITNIGDFTDYFAPPLPPGETGYVSPAGVAQVVLNVKAIPLGTTGSNALIGITQDLVGTGAKSRTGLFYTNSVNQKSRDAVGDNTAAAFGAEWKINNNWKLGGTYVGAQRNLDQGTAYELSSNMGLGGARIKIDPESIYMSPDGNAFANNFFYDNVQINSAANYQFNNTNAHVLTGGLNYSSGDWKASTKMSASVARGNFDTLSTTLLFNGADIRTNNGFALAANGVYGDLNSGSGNIKDYAWTMTPGAPFTVPTAPLRIDQMSTQSTNANSVYTGSFQIRNTPPTGVGFMYVSLSGQNQQTDNKIGGFQQDFERDVGDLPVVGKLLKSVQFGAKYEVDNFKSTYYRVTSYGANPAGLTPAILQGSFPGASSYAGGAAPGYNQKWQMGNLDALVNGLRPTAASLVPGQQLTPLGFPVVLGPTGYVTDPNHADQFTKNYTNDLSTSSLFLRANVDTKLFGFPLRGNVGLRHERTTKEINLIDRGLTTIGANKFVNPTPVTYKDTYAYTLPSLLLATDLRKDLVLRMGAYKTYVLPSRIDENPTTVFDYTQNTGGTSTYNVKLGKKDLKPYTAISGDIGVEWYNRSGSVVGLTVYQKNLNGYIMNFDKNSVPELACPANGLFNGVDYGTGPLTFKTNPLYPNDCVGVNDDEDNQQNGLPAVKIVNGSGAINSASLLKLRGVEFQVTQRLGQHFGGTFNYTLSSTKGTLPNGQPYTLTNASKRVANLIGWFEMGGFSTRLVLNHRGEYNILGGTATMPRFVKPRTQVDAVLSYRFKNGAQLALDLYNLTEARVESWQEDRRALRSVDFDGRTAVMTMRLPF
ncbi:MAG: TonB-dependent receptor [Pseudomonadota bacterium]